METSEVKKLIGCTLRFLSLEMAFYAEIFKNNPQCGWLATSKPIFSSNLEMDN
jgi:hypothetical protein